VKIKCIKEKVLATEMIGHTDEPTNGEIIDSDDVVCRSCAYSGSGIRAIVAILGDTKIERGEY
jgi:hypothetical protein